MFNRNMVNKVIRTLIISDFFLFFAVGLLGPIFAVFLMERIENKIEIVGYAVSFYWLTRVIMVIPISRLMDKIKGEFDECLFMALGTFMISAIPLFYIVSSEAWHIYLLQFLNGLAYALAVPAWRIVFTNHIDRSIIGFEWSLEDVAVGIATALSASVGAIIADKFGFNILFFAIFIFGTISASILITLNKSRRPILKELLRDRVDKAPLKIDSFK